MFSLILVGVKKRGNKNEMSEPVEERVVDRIVIAVGEIDEAFLLRLLFSNEYLIGFVRVIDNVLVSFRYFFV